MPLLYALQRINNQSGSQQLKEARLYIHQYIQFELTKNHETNYILTNNGERIYQEAEKIRLFTLFKEDYKALLQAIKANELEKLPDIAEEFNHIYTTYFTRYNIEVWPNDKKSQLSESKTVSEAKLPTHEVLLDCLLKTDLTGLQSALEILNDHHNQENFLKFINQPILSPSRVRMPILENYIIRLRGYYNYTEGYYKNPEPIHAFIYQAILLLVEHGAHTQSSLYDYHRNESLLFNARLSDPNPKQSEAKIGQTVFKALIDAGVDPAAPNSHGQSLLRTLLNQYCSNYNYFGKNNNFLFYICYLIVECGIKPELPSEFTWYTPESNVKKDLENTLQMQRKEKEEKYVAKVGLISEFSLFPKPLVQLTLEYCNDDSLAFLRSVRNLQ